MQLQNVLVNLLGDDLHGTDTYELENVDEILEAPDWRYFTALNNELLKWQFSNYKAKERKSLFLSVPCDLHNIEYFPNYVPQMRLFRLVEISARHADINP